MISTSVTATDKAYPICLTFTSITLRASGKEADIPSSVAIFRIDRGRPVIGVPSIRKIALINVYIAFLSFTFMSDTEQLLTTRQTPITSPTEHCSIHIFSKSFSVTASATRTSAAVLYACITTIVTIIAAIPSVGIVIIVQAAGGRFNLPHKARYVIAHTSPADGAGIQLITIGIQLGEIKPRITGTDLDQTTRQRQCITTIYGILPSWNRITIAIYSCCILGSATCSTVHIIIQRIVDIRIITIAVVIAECDTGIVQSAWLNSVTTILISIAITVSFTTTATSPTSANQQCRKQQQELVPSTGFYQARSTHDYLHYSQALPSQQAGRDRNHLLPLARFLSMHQ